LFLAALAISSGNDLVLYAFAPINMVRLVVARASKAILGDAGWLETSEQRTGATLLFRVAFRNIFIFFTRRSFRLPPRTTGLIVVYLTTSLSSTVRALFCNIGLLWRLPCPPQAKKACAIGKPD
jgi:hypothetical protein